MLTKLVCFLLRRPFCIDFLVQLKNETEREIVTILNIKRGQLYIVSEILNENNPPLYKLVNLRNEPIEQYFYGEQLTKTLKPTDSNYFFVEKVLGHKVYKKEKYYLCRFLYYDDSFNEYIPESNLTTDYRKMLQS